MTAGWMMNFQDFLGIIITAVVSYLVGSLNLSRFVTKYIGKTDITKIGSGNAGGTNVARAMGIWWGIGVIALEILKVVLLACFAVYVWPRFLTGTLGEGESSVVSVFVGFFCFLGNLFPIWHGFKGGKGVSAYFAIAFLVDWRVFLVFLATYLVVFILTRYSSLSSLCAVISVPLMTLSFRGFYPYFWIPLSMTVVAGILVFIRHRTNIKRLISGTENKLDLSKTK